jgi:hypothetical protein
MAVPSPVVEGLFEKLSIKVLIALRTQHRQEITTVSGSGSVSLGPFLDRAEWERQSAIGSAKLLDQCRVDILRTVPRQRERNDHLNAESTTWESAS